MFKDILKQWKIVYKLTTQARFINYVVNHFPFLLAHSLQCKKIQQHWVMVKKVVYINLRLWLFLFCDWIMLWEKNVASLNVSGVYLFIKKDILKLKTQQTLLTHITSARRPMLVVTIHFDTFPFYINKLKVYVWCQ